jgi:hypothetical protein
MNDNGSADAPPSIGSQIIGFMNDPDGLFYLLVLAVGKTTRPMLLMRNQLNFHG